MRAGYFDGCVGGAAEGLFYGEEEQDGGVYDPHAAGEGQGVLDLLGLHRREWRF